MNFNYSYKAFLISSLLVGGLLLLLISIKMSNTAIPSEEKEYKIEYAKELRTPEDEITKKTKHKTKIKTHNPYNENEKFIAELEKERAKQKQKPAKSNIKPPEVIEVSKDDPLQNRPLNPDEKSEKKPETKTDSNNRNTTISYQLLNRKAIVLPNPVYTCEGFGKVAVHIKVNAIGKVTTAKLIKNSSTTSNACLIENAIQYAKKAQFSPSSKEIQIGSITYIFPGQ